MLGIVNVILFIDGFCFIPLNSVGLYSDGLLNFMELNCSFQSLLLSFARGNPEKLLI